MKDLYNREVEKHVNTNTYTVNNGIVLFGGAFCKEMPVNEFKEYFKLDFPIYNRSFQDIYIADAIELLEKCVLPLHPKKILLNLGESDLASGYKTIDELIDEYEKVINTIKSNDKHIDIVLISVCNTSNLEPNIFNGQLEKLADKLKCNYADISTAIQHEYPHAKAFNTLKCFMRDKITFFDAMNMVTIK